MPYSMQGVSKSDMRNRRWSEILMIENASCNQMGDVPDKCFDMHSPFPSLGQCKFPPFIFSSPFRHELSNLYIIQNPEDLTDLHFGIKMKQDLGIDIDNYLKIRNIFFPSSNDKWLPAVISYKDKEQCFKVYLDPSIQGDSKSCKPVHRAILNLGMTYAHKTLIDLHRKFSLHYHYISIDLLPLKFKEQATTQVCLSMKNDSLQNIEEFLNCSTISETQSKNLVANVQSILRHKRALLSAKLDKFPPILITLSWTTSNPIPTPTIYLNVYNFFQNDNYVMEACSQFVPSNVVIELQQRLTPGKKIIQYLSMSFDEQNNIISEIYINLIMSKSTCPNLEKIEQRTNNTDLNPSTEIDPGHLPPFKIKTCEPITLSTKAERFKWITDAKYNLFNLKTNQIILDFLTDSGTGAMSAKQTAHLITGDETYAGSSSFDNFKQAVQTFTGFKHIIPVHQGRAGERILFSTLGVNSTHVIPSNGFFDTTRANVELLGGKAVDLLQRTSLTNEDFHFQGNADIHKMEACLLQHEPNVPFVLITATNNTYGGQPVSIQNIQQVSKLCKRFGKPLFIDACRIAENSYFIKLHDPEYKYKSCNVSEIILKFLQHADGMIMSAKKDGLSHIGGWIAVKESSLAEKIQALLVVTEGFSTYGGLAGRDLDAIAQGLREVVDERYLAHRINSVANFGQMLQYEGIPVQYPFGGHAIYIDANTFLQNAIPSDQFPAHSLSVQLYIEGGIRTCGLGKFVFPHCEEELLRVAIPRRVYSKEHFEYAVKVFAKVFNDQNSVKGMRIVKTCALLRHFTAELSPL